MKMKRCVRCLTVRPIKLFPRLLVHRVTGDSHGGVRAGKHRMHAPYCTSCGPVTFTTGKILPVTAGVLTERERAEQIESGPR